MPYSNTYNRRIADDIDAINERYSTLYAYSPIDGRGNEYSYGGSNAGVLFQMGSSSKRDGEDNIYNNHNNLPPVYYYGNDSEGMQGGSGFAEGTYRDTGFGEQLGAGAEGVYAKGEGISGGSCDRKIGGSKDGAEFGRNVATEFNEGVKTGGAWYNDVLSTIGDVGSALAPFAPLLLALGKPHPSGGSHMQELGRIMGEDCDRGMKGGAWYNDVLKGIGDVGSVAMKLAPFLMALGKPKKGRKKACGISGGDLAQAEISTPAGAGKVSAAEKKKAKNVLIATQLAGAPGMLGAKIYNAVTGGSILGNRDPYPIQGDSERVAGRGRGRPKGVRGMHQVLTGTNGDLLAMSSDNLPSGVPPNQMLRGSYGGKKPSAKDKKIIASVKKMLGGESIVKEMPQETGGKRVNKRAEIVKKVMKDKGMKMIEASKYVKEHGLYKK